MLRSLLLWLVFCLGPVPALAQAAPFDLAGPKLQVTVTRGGLSLPISKVPDLAAGDLLSIKADLPASQAARYLLVTGFLRGATNPPPKNWFQRAETWNTKGRDVLNVTVPAGAQQVIVFLAPQTGGDFKTLVDAVRGRPGAFVRASQDLNQASLDRSRLDAFLAAVRKGDPDDPDRLKTISPLLARSLTIKLNPDCFQKMPELQAACLMQGQEALVLSDGHSTSIVEALTTGNLGDLTQQLSYTPQAGYGYYSTYLGAVRDIARVLDGLHTAQYQYIPALATVSDDHLALVLNTPPSFHNPLSVLVTALPAVEAPQAPPLRPVDAKAAYCAARTELVLPAEGAPLVYSTRYAHDLVLRVKVKDGSSVDLPVRAEAEKGALVADTGKLASMGGGVIDGSLHGFWGFEPFEGPRFRLQNPYAGWRLSAEDERGLIVGRDDAIHLEGQSAACIESIALGQGDAPPRKVEWKAVDPDKVLVTAPLADAKPGAMTLLVKQYGMAEPEAVGVKAFAQAAHMDSFTLHAGDLSGRLKGARLDQVAGLSLAGLDFTPGALATAGGGDDLELATTDSVGAGQLKSGQAVTARVALKDGRSVILKVRVAAARAHATLIDKSVQAPTAAGPLTIRLSGADQAPQNAVLTFSVRLDAPASFSGRDVIEVATLDGSATASLTPANGLILEDAHVALAQLDTAKAFNSSTFGPLQFRVVQDGAAGDWRPLATLVRLPVLRDLKCQDGAERPCQLSGSGLFLIDSISRDPAFDHSLKVPEGFPGQVMAAPHPSAGKLYVRLRDDPAVVNPVIVAGARP